jgi:translation elongation factor EF-1alpha
MVLTGAKTVGPKVSRKESRNNNTRKESGMQGINIISISKEWDWYKENTRKNGCNVREPRSRRMNVYFWGKGRDLFSTLERMGVS